MRIPNKDILLAMFSIDLQANFGRSSQSVVHSPDDLRSAQDHTLSARDPNTIA